MDTVYFIDVGRGDGSRKSLIEKWKHFFSSELTRVKITFKW